MYYLSYLFRLRLLSEGSYLLERLQSADKTKMHPKAKLQNAPTYTGTQKQSYKMHPLILGTEATLMFQQMTHRCIHKLYFSNM